MNGSFASLLVYDSMEDVGDVENAEHSELVRLLLEKLFELSDHSW